MSASSFWSAPWPAGWHVLDPHPVAGPVPVGLELGDVLLFSPVSPSLLQQGIVVAQLAADGNELSHACWTHVAIHVGGSQLIDATPFNNVATRQFATVAESSFVRARRSRNVTPREQQEVVDAARQLQGKYAYLEALVDAVLAGSLPPGLARAVHLLLHSTGHGGQHLGVPPKRPFHCSSLVEAAYVTGINKSVIGAGIVAALPCTFSADPTFDEVPISWP